MAIDEMSRNSCNTSCVRNTWSDQNTLDAEPDAELSNDFAVAALPAKQLDDCGRFVIVRSTCKTSSITLTNRKLYELKTERFAAHVVGYFLCYINIKYLSWNEAAQVYFNILGVSH